VDGRRPNSLNFIEWLLEVDRILEECSCLDHYYLDERPWFEWWQNGMIPDEAAHITLKVEGLED
jgi:hypothetical protein